ncbi:MAG: hypothetical protein ABI880_00535 [Acidobacteriota bacterium]
MARPGIAPLTDFGLRDHCVAAILVTNLERGRVTRLVPGGAIEVIVAGRAGGARG